MIIQRNWSLLTTKRYFMWSSIDLSYLYFVPKRNKQNHTGPATWISVHQKCWKKSNSLPIGNSIKKSEKNTMYYPGSHTERTNERLIVHMFFVVVHWHLWPKRGKRTFWQNEIVISQTSALDSLRGLANRKDQDLHFPRACYAITSIVQNKSKEAITCQNSFMHMFIGFLF